MTNVNNAPEPMLDDLYRELILDHYRHPHNRGHLDHKTAGAEGFNPVCGDEIAIDVEVDNGLITNVGFVGRGCSISQASGSMMTDAIKGKTKAEAIDLVRAFKRLMTNPEEEVPEELGDLEAFQGVSKFPVRVKCATLAWNVLEEGLEQT